MSTTQVRAKEAFAQAIQMLKRNCRASAESRHAHVVAISELVEECRREGHEALEAFLDGVVQRTLSQLVQSNDPTDVAAGTLCLEGLLEVELPVRHLLLLGNFLRRALLSADKANILLAAHTLGIYVSAAGATARDLIDQQTTAAVHWLSEKEADKRYPAVVVLRELAVTDRTNFGRIADKVVDAIWGALADGQQVIRDAAAETLRLSLQVVSDRSSPDNNRVYRQVWSKCVAALESRRPESIHGALLVCVDVLQSSLGVLDGCFQQAWSLAWAQKDSVNALIKRQTLITIPALLRFSFECTTDVRNSDILKDTMIHLLNLTAKEVPMPEKSAALLAIAEILSFVHAKSFEPYLDQSIYAVKGLLQAHKIKGKPPVWEALVCLARIATKCPGTMTTAHVASSYDAAFSWGLAPQLTTSLQEISAACPTLKPTIQNRLMDLISIVICGLPFRSTSGSRATEIRGPAPEDCPRQITLALSTLRTFDFTGIDLTEFTRDCVVPFFRDDDPLVRSEAVITASKVLLPHSLGKDDSMPDDTVAVGDTYPIIMELLRYHAQRSEIPAPSLRGHKAELVRDVLDQLLSLGVSDADPRIRLIVFEHLGTDFDPYLAHAHYIELIFMACNDCNSRVASLALTLLGRISYLKPAHILPAVRRHFLEMLTTLETEGNQKQHEEALTRLSLLLPAAPHVMRVYAVNILSALIRNVALLSGARDACFAFLNCLCSLAVVAGTQLKGADNLNTIVGKMMPLLQVGLPDRTSSLKRHIAIRTLGCVFRNTGDVLSPYVRFPNLLTALRTMIRADDVPDNTKCGVVQLLGILGALDPMRLQTEQEDPSDSTRSTLVDAHNASPMSLCLTQMVLAEVIGMLPTATSSGLQYMAIRTVTDLCTKCLDPKIEVKLDVIGSLLQFIHTVRDSVVIRFVINHMVTIIRASSVPLHKHLKAIQDLVVTWRSQEALKPCILSLLAALASVVGHNMKPYIPIMLPELSQILCATNYEASFAFRFLKIIVAFGKHSQEALSVIIPEIMTIAERATTVAARVASLRTLRVIGQHLSLADVSNQIVQPITALLSSLDHTQIEVFKEAMSVLCLLVQQLGPRYLIFVSTVHATVRTHRMTHPLYDQLVSNCLRGVRITPSEVAPSNVETQQLEMWLDSADAAGDMDGDFSHTQTMEPEGKLTVNTVGIETLCRNAMGGTLNREDWVSWFHNLQVEVVSQAPHQALRYYATLLRHSQVVSKGLFNGAFYEVWEALTANVRQSLTRAFETAFAHQQCPNDVRLSLLVLAESMDARDCPLPLNPTQLAAVAVRTNSVAKALHWREMEFHHGPVDVTATVEETLMLYQQASQPESAIGLLAYAQKEYAMTMKEGWYVKLGRWREALDGLEKERATIIAQNPTAGYRLRKRESHIQEDQAERRLMEIDVSIMRCLSHLCEWRKLHDFVSQVWSNFAQDVGMSSVDSTVLTEGTEEEGESFQSAIAPFAVKASWIMGQWETFEDTLSYLPKSSFDVSFFEAICAIRKKSWSAAQGHIEEARRRLLPDITLRMAEGYERAYSRLIMAQQLAELEEVILVEQCAGTEKPPQLERTQQMWKERLHSGVEANSEYWEVLLHGQNLLLSREQELSEWLVYTSLCGHKGQHEMALLALKGIDKNIEQFNIRTARDANVAFAYIKHVFASGARDDAICGMLEKLISSLEAMPMSNTRSVLLSQCHVKLSTMVGADNRLQQLESATYHDPSWYKAWHLWAVANTEQLEHLRRASGESLTTQMQAHVSQAIKGFVNSIRQGPSTSTILQDALRLMSLWFKYGGNDTVADVIQQHIDSIPISTWVLVLPQLLARVNIPHVRAATQIRQLLLRVGENNPQALIYPLMVAMTSSVEGRREAAEEILAGMRAKYDGLVNEAIFFSNELIRLAILWHENWFDKLEEASKLFFDRKDGDAMVNLLLPLHDELRNPQTLNEAWFSQSFNRELAEAEEWCRSYIVTKNMHDLHHAWDNYIQVFWKISKLVQQAPPPPLDLQFCSPRLYEAKNLDLSMPGQKGNVRIRSFGTKLQVLSSKQRPRRLTVNGDDGLAYKFLLKGHEDLRLDERVMQLFQLLNTLLTADHECSRLSALVIQRYAVIPLSINVGLIGWLEACDTIHQMVKEFRESKQIAMNVETRHILHMVSPQNVYDFLPLIGKVEVFQYVLDNTSGQDLHRVLWLRSGDAETWIDHRRNYTRSLATMSMAGYILGLGDRHPNNLMMQRHTGKIVHIDFGDCFEVTMTREKYPERIPFRLTRMLCNALELGSVEGLYRTTCELVMRVIREHRDSVMAMLEAFVHDPLISWRLVEAKQAPDAAAEEDATADSAIEAAEARLASLGIDRHNASKNLTTFEATIAKHDDAGSLQSAFDVLIRASMRTPTRQDGIEKAPKRTVRDGEDEGLGEGSHQGVNIIRRIKSKLHGKEFAEEALPVGEQVGRLIEQATSVENLCQCYIGWCPFW